MSGNQSICTELVLITIIKYQSINLLLTHARVPDDTHWSVIFLHLLSGHSDFPDLPSQTRAAGEFPLHVPCLPIPNTSLVYFDAHYRNCTVHGPLLHRHDTTKWRRGAKTASKVRRNSLKIYKVTNLCKR